MGISDFLKGIVKDSVAELLKEEKSAAASSIEDASKIQVVSNRFVKLSNNLTFVRNVHTTTFCNKEDFKGDTYTLASGKLVTPISIKGMIGVALPYKMNPKRVIGILHPVTGQIFSYLQVDVGPGYTNDRYWITMTNPKNESGKDHLGNKSPKSGLDVFPGVLVEMGLATWDQAFNGSMSFDFDILIWEPSEEAVKTDHVIPTSDKRDWFKTLPAQPHDWFPWNELLRGWNKQEAPPKEYIANLSVLAKEILVPAREVLGPLKVSSGLRDAATNKRVGGREGSFHLNGRAVDLIPMKTSFQKLYDWLRTGPVKSKLRECVWEQWGHSSNEHVHLAGVLKPGENQNIRIKP